MEGRVNELEGKVKLIEYKVDLHHEHIDQLIESIKSLSGKIDKKIEKDIKIEYIGRGIVLILIVEQFGLLEIVGKYIGVR